LEETHGIREFAKVEMPALLNESVGLLQAVPLWINPRWLAASNRLEPPLGWSPDLGPIEAFGDAAKVIGRGFKQGLVFRLVGLDHGQGDYTFQQGLFWVDSDEIWPPSIDALHALGYLASAIEPESVSSILDIGCGSGVLGSATAHWAMGDGNGVKVSFLDINPAAVELSDYNARRLLRHHPEIERLVGSVDLKQLRTSGRRPKYDLCISAPPYLPHIDELSGRLWPAVAGTHLLEQVLESANRWSRRLVLVYSSIAQEAVDRILPDSQPRELGLAAFAIPPYASYCRWPEWLPWTNEGADLREILEETPPSQLTPGLLHFRDRILPFLLDVERPEGWNPAELQWASKKPYRFYHRVRALDLEF
jgi:methylase of polypeptide subunit release factors